MRAEEERKAAQAEVAVAKVAAVGRVDLRVGEEVADALDVDDEQAAALVCCLMRMMMM